ncbi:MAG: exosortase-associated EpsI family protein [Lentisphaeria bacterium]
MTKPNRHKLIFSLEARIALLCLAGFIPLLTKFPYMVQAWKQSSLDRPDSLFLLLFLLMLTASLPKIISARQAPPDWRALSILLPAFLLFVVSHIYRINAIGIIAGIIFAWAVFWLCLSWPAALLATPSFGVLLLSCTSSRYWLTHFLMPLQLDGIFIKIIFAFFCLLCLILLLTRKIRFSPGSFCFANLFVLGLLLLLHGQSSHTQNPPCQPSFKSLISGDFIGKPSEITDFDRHFFQDAILKKYYFASRQQAINVLNVTCSNNIHQIHPASHCLRTSGWKILQENPTDFFYQNKKIAITEIIAQNKLTKMMVWVWYSNQYRSVGNFLRFRSLYPTWKDDEIWHEYQIATPCGKDEQKSHIVLQDFLKNLNP